LVNINNLLNNKECVIFNLSYFNKFLFFNKVIHGDWGLGIGDWGLGIGDWGLGPIKNKNNNKK
jgi:hypothetical protein